MYHSGTIIRVVLLVCLMIVVPLFSPGCISSSVRFTRDSSSGGSGHKVRTVPATWDYRSTYSVPCARLQETARSYLGIRYRFGAMSRKSTDCSGLVCMVYREVSHAKLPRSTGKQWAIGNPVQSGAEKCGDLVFFKGGIFGRINHVGICLEKGTFIHASVRRGVMINKLDEPYYRERYAGTKRIFR